MIGSSSVGKTDLEVSAEMLAAAKNLLDQLEAKSLRSSYPLISSLNEHLSCINPAPYERWNKLNAF